MSRMTPPITTETRARVLVWDDLKDAATRCRDKADEIEGVNRVNGYTDPAPEILRIKATIYDRLADDVAGEETP